jgi:hypothetical protein
MLLAQLLLLFCCLAGFTSTAVGGRPAGAAGTKVGVCVAMAEETKGGETAPSQFEGQEERIEQVKCCWCAKVQADLSQLLSCEGCGFATQAASSAYLEPLCVGCYNTVHQTDSAKPCGGTQQQFLAPRVCSRQDCTAAAAVFCEPCKSRWCCSCSNIVHSRDNLSEHQPVQVGAAVAIAGEKGIIVMRRRNNPQQQQNRAQLSAAVMTHYHC